MDTTRFDRITRTLAEGPSRRELLRLLGLSAFGAGSLSLLGAAETEAKKRRKKKRKHKKKKKPTCKDGRKNGFETDVDCGGTCPRCADGQTCGVANDCVSGTCTNGQCVACTPDQLCGSDASGACQCNEDFETGEPVCNQSDALGLTVDDCAKCPEGTESCVTINGLLFNCYKHCGSA